MQQAWVHGSIGMCGLSVSLVIDKAPNPFEDGGNRLVSWCNQPSRFRPEWHAKVTCLSTILTLSSPGCQTLSSSVR
jgi:hypothetical protein